MNRPHPAQPHPPAPAAPALPTPSLLRRMACWLYEGMLLFGVVFIAGYLFSALTQTRHALDNRHLQQAFIFVVLGIYFTWFWHQGQTLAMKTWHIRIVDRMGRPISQTRALWRYLLAWLWFWPPLALREVLDLPALEVVVLLGGWIAVWAVLARFHPDRQFWHDAWAGTRLVDTRPAPPPTRHA
ncbi:MAG: RDD family protein [Pseudomonadota bacterium]